MAARDDDAMTETAKVLPSSRVTGPLPDQRMAGAFDRMWSDLAPLGRDAANGGYRRFAFTAVDLALREWFVGEAAARGLDVDEDRAGNLYAWWGDPTSGDAVLTGSHLDSVPSGGAFDGPLGVVSALLAVDELRARGVTPTRPLAIAVFAEEEGSRFGVACAGSRLLTGQLDPDRARSLADDDGIEFHEALRRSGRDPQRLGPDENLLRSIGVFVELHIEQGRGLVDLDAPVGLGTAIRPHGRWRFDLIGRADHAGTTLIADRNDPMLAQASLVLAAREAAASRGAIATIGRLAIEPNAVNAIPSRVSAWLDARADEEHVVREVVRELEERTGIPAIEESWSPNVELDAELRQALAARLGNVPELPTGAGHDAGILALAGIPTAMVFVRNPTGTSHSPCEHAERDDCLVGVLALADALESLLVHRP